jgi:hypothetical protein
MRSLGDGRDLWRVEVVLWVPTPEADRVRELVDTVAAATATNVGDDQPVSHGADVEQAWSYDIQPPEGGVGVACWVRADSVGDAADTAWGVIQAAAARVLGTGARLWDVRVLPCAAILTASDTGTPLERRRPRSSGVRGLYLGLVARGGRRARRNSNPQPSDP